MSRHARCPSSLEIARSVTPRPIMELARELGLHDDEVELYGPYKAKVSLAGITRLEAEAAAKGKRGKYVVVTAITPTPLGEGKTTTNIGLVQGLNRIGRRAAVCIRQPSLGPVFGIKGGAAGGGYSQVIPMEDFNLHLTGDNHAVGAAHNLLAAFVDNSLHARQPARHRPAGRPLAARRRHLGPRRPQGDHRPGRPRERLPARDRVADHRRLRGDGGPRPRLGPAGPARAGSAGWSSRPPSTAAASPPRTCECAGSMTVLLRDAIKPNLLQTLEGGPAFVHCGPFANIAHGNNSVLADRLALATCEIACTEAGFGADMGAEKFFDIKCRQSGLRPDAAVMVATVRALKMHGGVGRIVAGRPLDPALDAGERRRGPQAARPTWPPRSRTSASSTCRWSWRSTTTPATPRRKSPRSGKWRWPPARATWS